MPSWYCTLLADANEMSFMIQRIVLEDGSDGLIGSITSFGNAHTL